MNPSSQPLGSYPYGQPEVCRSREKVACEVGEVLTRLELILSVLEELTKRFIPAAGDAELRRGCERALTSILAALAQIEPAEHSSAPPGREERAVKARLNGERLSLLIEGDMLACLWSFVVRLLP